MVNKKIWLVIPVMALVFGMTVVGCDDGSTDNNNSTNNNGENLPAASGVNAVSGKTYFEGEERIVFSVTADGAKNGTYTKGGTTYYYDYQHYYAHILENGKYKYPTTLTVRQEYSGDVVLENGKYKYTDIEIGTYTWNEGAKTITLKPEKVALVIAGEGQTWTALMDKAGYKSYLTTMMNEQIEYYRLNWDEMYNYNKDFFESIGIFSSDDYINYLLAGMGFSSIAAYINYSVDEAFANKTNTYSFSTDGTALFLEKALPANKGTNELSGQTYYGLTYNWNSDTEEGEWVKDTNKVYVFTASGYTFTRNYDYGSVYSYTETETGSYAYDSIRKRVYLRRSTINRKDRAAYYAELTAYSGHYFVDDNAYRAAETNGAFNYFYEQPYNSTNKTIGWED